MQLYEFGCDAKCIFNGPLRPQFNLHTWHVYMWLVFMNESIDTFADLKLTTARSGRDLLKIIFNANRVDLCARSWPQCRQSRFTKTPIHLRCLRRNLVLWPTFQREVWRVCVCVHVWFTYNALALTLLVTFANISNANLFTCFRLKNVNQRDARAFLAWIN